MIFLYECYIHFREYFSGEVGKLFFLQIPKTIEPYFCVYMNQKYFIKHTEPYKQKKSLFLKKTQIKV